MRARVIPETEVKEVRAVDVMEMLREASEKSAKAMQESIDELFEKFDRELEEFYCSAKAEINPQSYGQLLFKGACRG